MRSGRGYGICEIGECIVLVSEIYPRVRKLMYEEGCFGGDIGHALIA